MDLLYSTTRDTMNDESIILSDGEDSNKPSEDFNKPSVVETLDNNCMVDIIVQSNPKKRKIPINKEIIPEAKRQKTNHKYDFPQNLITDDVEKMTIYKKYSVFHRNKRILPEYLAGLVVLKRTNWNSNNNSYFDWTFTNYEQMIKQYKLTISTNRCHTTIKLILNELRLHKYDYLIQYGSNEDICLLCKHFFPFIYNDIVKYINSIEKNTASQLTPSPIIQTPIPVPKLHILTKPINNLALPSFDSIITEKLSYLENKLIVMEYKIKKIEQWIVEHN